MFGYEGSMRFFYRLDCIHDRNPIFLAWTAIDQRAIVYALSVSTPLTNNLQEDFALLFNSLR